MKTPKYIVPEDYMADPSVHIFDGKLYTTGNQLTS